MRLPKKFKDMTDIERRKYANRVKANCEKALDFWTKVCQKLSRNTDFTPIEMDIIDIQLEKEQPK